MSGFFGMARRIVLAIRSQGNCVMVHRWLSRLMNKDYRPLWSLTSTGKTKAIPFARLDW